MSSIILQAKKEVFDNYIDGNEENTHNELLSLLSVKLGEGIAVFFYLKSNGEVRKAIGTKCADFMPEITQKDSGKPKKKPNDSLITYYDLEAKAPRAMKKENLIAIF